MSNSENGKRKKRCSTLCFTFLNDDILILFPFGCRSKTTLPDAVLLPVLTPTPRPKDSFFSPWLRVPIDHDDAGNFVQNPQRPSYAGTFPLISDQKRWFRAVWTSWCRPSGLASFNQVWYEYVFTNVFKYCWCQSNSRLHFKIAYRACMLAIQSL